jgi:hypothetical protein
MKIQELINKLWKIEVNDKDKELINLACKKLAELWNKINTLNRNK